MDTSDYILKTNREYAIYVASNRAIPAVQDGLKHVQRVVLHLLSKRSDKIKTVALSGLAAAEKLYVHGDASCNNAIGLLAAPYKNSAPLIQGIGQFGSRTMPGEIGAPRYTDVKRSLVAEKVLYRDLDLVPMVENYDGSNTSPKHFLPLVPTVLLNGVSGIAVGFSTEILPRSLKGLIQACQDALKGAKTLRGLDPHFERYDVSVTSLGPNKYEFHGKAKIEDTSTVRITELPPGMAIEDFRKRLIAMEDAEEIVNFTDRSTDQIDIAVRFKRGSVKDWGEAKAIDFFKLRERSTERIVVLDWTGNAIHTYPSAEDLVRDFVEWRLGWYTTRFEKRLADALLEETYWRVLAALFAAGFPKLLGSFDNREEMEAVIEEVASEDGLTLADGQMDRVVSLPTYRWTKTFEAEIAAKIAALAAEIAEYRAILASPDRLKAVYMSELDELKATRF